jgi:hypothetical protein
MYYFQGLTIMNTGINTAYNDISKGKDSINLLLPL